MEGQLIDVITTTELRRCLIKFPVKTNTLHNGPCQHTALNKNNNNINSVICHPHPDAHIRVWPIDYYLIERIVRQTDMGLGYHPTITSECGGGIQLIIVKVITNQPQRHEPEIIALHI